MSDLISRKDVLHELDWCDYGLKDWQKWKLKMMVRDIPSAHPNNECEKCVFSPFKQTAQSEIIRCKDCKHLQKWRSEESAKKFGQIYECVRNVLDCPKPEDFCSHAERRTG